MLKLLKRKLQESTFELYSEEIKKRNQENYKHVALIGHFLSMTVLVLGLLFFKYVPFNFEFIMLVVYFVIVSLFYKFYISKNNKHVTIHLYLAITPVLIMGIIIGTFLDPFAPSITIMALLCVMPLFVIDKYSRVFIFITATAVAYCICCYIAKDFEQFMEDLTDLVMFYSLSIGVNYYTLREKINGVESYVKLRDKSERDLLTGIYNRGTGVEKIKNYIDNKVYGAFFMIDIDNFKSYNDNYGHKAGDEVIKAVANLLNSFSNNDNIVFRMGGDEMAMYIVDIKYREECEDICNKIAHELKNIMLRRINNKQITISIGCALFDERITSFSELYCKSDSSLYEAKRGGRNCYCINS